MDLAIFSVPFHYLVIIDLWFSNFAFRTQYIYNVLFSFNNKLYVELPLTKKKETSFSIPQNSYIFDKWIFKGYTWSVWPCYTRLYHFVYQQEVINKAMKLFFFRNCITSLTISIVTIGKIVAIRRKNSNLRWLILIL